MGVFNKSCAIHYESYRNVFSTLGFGAIRQTVPQQQISKEINQQK